MLVGTPSGVTLAPEGGAHQSIGAPLIGMSQDGLAAFEPAFADELAIIMEWAFDYLQRDGDGRPATSAPGCATRRAARSTCGSRPARSNSRARDRGCRIPPGRDRRRLLAAPAGPELRGRDRLSGRGRRRGDRGGRRASAEGRRDIGVLAVTSADRLNAGWHGRAARPRARAAQRQSQIERLLAGLPRALRADHRDRRPPGDALLARRGAGPPRRAARGRAFRPDRHDRAICTGISASTATHARDDRGAVAGAGPPAAREALPA